MINIIFIYLCFWVFISSCFIRWVVGLNCPPEEEPIHHKQLEKLNKYNSLYLDRTNSKINWNDIEDEFNINYKEKLMEYLTINNTKNELDFCTEMYNKVPSNKLLAIKIHELLDKWYIDIRRKYNYNMSTTDLYMIYYKLYLLNNNMPCFYFCEYLKNRSDYDKNQK